MKKALKWILGILLVVVIVAALVAVPFAMHSNMLARASFNNQPQLQAQRGWNNGPMMGGNQRGDNGLQGRAQGRFENRGGPMMGDGFRRGFAPFGFGLMFFGGLLRLIPLVLFGLLLYAVYQLGKRAGMRKIPAAVPAPAAPEPPVTDSPADIQAPVI
jgi:hypothetical protein